MTNSRKIHGGLILVDFDGTLAEHEYPRIGPEIPLAIQTCLELRGNGLKLGLWTMRSGRLLEDAVAWCRERGLEFDFVNEAPPDQVEWSSSRKVHGIVIDDHALGCPLKLHSNRRPHVDWKVARRLLKSRGLLP